MGVRCELRCSAAASGDISLVGLASLASDAVALTAVRESVILYTECVTFGRSMPPPGYHWEVDPELERRAKALVVEFNSLFGEAIPTPEPAAARVYCEAADKNAAVGRCVRLGQDQRSPPHYYHWAIYGKRRGGLVIQEFWQPTVWTTIRYVDLLVDSYGCPDMDSMGIAA